jgi:glyoxylase-like metal-dependent hydrolase (beta-lactamase superfamily II)
MVAAGPTPGHMTFLLESAGRSLLLTGDTATILLLPGKNRIGKFLSTWTKAPLPAVAEGYSICWLPRNSRFIGYHMPHPSAGYVETLDTGFRFVPVSYQFLI